MADKKYKLLEILEKKVLADRQDFIDYLSLLKQLDRTYKDKHKGKENAELHDKNKLILKPAVFKKLNDASIGLVERNEYMRIYKDCLKFDALSDFDSYLLFLEFDREPSQRFYMPRRKVFLKFGIIQSFQGLEDDELDILTISLPPGTGKSTLGIFFLSWVMGKYPNECNLASAYGDKLTRSFYNGVMAIITDDEYNWKELFPDVKLQATNTKDETINLDLMSRNQTLTCRSIDGALTGATRCTKYLYADDLVSGIEEAMSKPRMDTLWNKYGTDLKSRKKQYCKEIHIATRWTIHDPIGRIQRLMEGNDRAKFISIPALDENGNSNFKYDFGVGFDEKYFNEIKATIDEVSFKALFMNEPVEREGLLYFGDELKRYYELPIEEPDAIVAVADTANGGGDYTCLLVGYMYGQEVYIHDLVYMNAVPTLVKPLLVKCLYDNRVQRGRFESNSAGGEICDDVQKQLVNLKARCSLTKSYTTGNKETRIFVNSDYVKKNFLFKDKTMYTSNSMYGKFIEDVLSYTLVGKNKHDDSVDTLAMLAVYIDDITFSKPEFVQRIF